MVVTVKKSNIYKLACLFKWFDYVKLYCIQVLYIPVNKRLVEFYCDKMQKSMQVLFKMISRIFFITSTFIQIGVYWYWSSGEEVGYTNWGDFEPSENILNSDEGCVYMDTSGFWHDDSCNNEYAFICKHYGKEIF